MEGVLLGLYQYTPFKTIDRENIREMSEFTILDGEESAVKTIRNAARTAEIIADAVCICTRHRFNAGQ